MNTTITPTQATQNAPATAPVSPSPDALGGAAVAHSPSSALTVSGRRIRALAVSDCPALQDLDLTRLPAGVHVTLERCPQLRRLHLPAAGAGAVIHLDAGEKPPALFLDGLVDLFDACWTGGELAVKAPGPRPLAGCRVGPGVGTLQGLDREAAVILGDVGAEALRVPAASALRHLQVHGAERLFWIELGGERLEQVALNDCPRLTRVDTAVRAHRLRMDRCPALGRVTGDGGALSIAGDGGEAAALAVEGAWEHLNLVQAGATSLVAPYVRDVLLRGCAALRSIEVADDTEVSLSGQAAPAGLRIDRLNLDERAVDTLIERAREGDQAAVQTLLDWPESARRAGTRLLALRGLLGLARLGVDPAAIWRRRCRLHVRCGEPRRQKLTDADALAYAETRWQWRFPDDLTQQGWDCDLALWLCCRHTPEAERFEDTIRRAAELDGLATLARALIRQQAEGRADDTLHRLLQAAAQGDLLLPNRRRLRNRPFGGGAPAISATEMDAVDQLIQVAVALRDRAIADALAAVNDPLSVEQRITLLGSLAAFGHGPSRTALIRLASELRDRSRRRVPHAIQALLPKQREVLSQRATGLALAPSRSTALAGGDYTHAEEGERAHA